MSVSLYIAAIAAMNTRGGANLEFSPMLVVASDMTQAIEQCRPEVFKRWPKASGWQAHQVAIEPAPPDVVEDFLVASGAGSFIDSIESSTLTIF